MRLAVVVVVGLLAASCATSKPNDTAPSATAQSDKVCKRMTTTGSNMPQNVCRTKEEWAAIEKQGREGVEEFERARSELNPQGQ